MSDEDNKFTHMQCALLSDALRGLIQNGFKEYENGNSVRTDAEQNIIEELRSMVIILLEDKCLTPKAKNDLIGMLNALDKENLVTKGKDESGGYPGG